MIRTKATPLILDLRDVAEPDYARAIEAALDGFRTRYRAYFGRQAEARPQRRLTALDPDPRVVLAPGANALIGVGASPKAARIAADLYEHTIDVIESAEAVGRYQALPDAGRGEGRPARPRSPPRPAQYSRRSRGSGTDPQQQSRARLGESACESRLARARGAGTAPQQRSLARR